MPTRKKSYELLAISPDLRKELPEGTTYFKLIFDNVEGIGEVIGYYRTLADAKKAYKSFVKEELGPCAYSEFILKEYLVSRTKDGKFIGRFCRGYVNDYWDFMKIIDRNIQEKESNHEQNKKSATK